jgi:ribosomal protein S18 acetylase RimI-like enzyme
MVGQRSSIYSTWGRSDAVGKLGALQRGHRSRIREILDATSAFRDDEVAVALELFDETFALGPARAPYDPGDGVANYEFVGSFSRDGQLVGYVCYGATPGTDRVYDLYWIAMHPDFQGEGGGTQLLDEVERRLRQREARLLVVETSSRTDYAATRHFYEARGYDRAASLEDYYAPGDARVIYTKRFDTAEHSLFHMRQNAELSRNE